MSLSIRAADIRPFWKFGVKAKALAIEVVPIMSAWETLQYLIITCSLQKIANSLEDVTVRNTIIPHQSTTVVHASGECKEHYAPGQSEYCTPKVHVPQSLSLVGQKVYDVQLVECVFTAQRHHSSYIAHRLDCYLKFKSIMVSFDRPFVTLVDFCRVSLSDWFSTCMSRCWKKVAMSMTGVKVSATSPNLHS